MTAASAWDDDFIGRKCTTPTLCRFVCRFSPPHHVTRGFFKYAPVQEKAISKLSVLDPGGEDCVDWIPFRDYFWGKTLDTLFVEEPVERDDKPIKAFPVHPPLMRTVATIPPHISLPFSFMSQKVLVRSEYKEAERAAVLANKPAVQVFVISGQPGIGLPSPPPPPSLAESNI